MFTGIIEEIGKVKEFIMLPKGAKLKISCGEVLNGTKIGDSIAVNGCCQTVVEIGKDYFMSEASEETLKITDFSELKTGSEVNLERALTPTTRMGGHIVQGHVDCVGKLIFCEKYSGFYNMKFEVPKENLKYIVTKGSISINGVSLTVTEINNNVVMIAVIPHTYLHTNLSNLSIGESVNIETDILSRYIENFLSSENNNNKLDENFLIENGFM